MKRNVSRRMTGGRLQHDAVVDLVIHGHKIGPVGFHNRQNAVVEHVVANLRRAQHLLPVIVFRLSENVAGVRKSRHPAAVFELGVPSDVVDVQVGAHYDIDFLGAHADCGKIGHVRPVLLVPVGTARPVLVIADAGIQQDRQPPGADNVTLEREQHHPGFGIHIIRCHPRKMLFHHFLGGVRIHLSKGAKRYGRFFD